jgi:hypothetical protein
MCHCWTPMCQCVTGGDVLLPISIDFKSVFNRMSQTSPWTILEAYNVPDREVDLLKSFDEYTTVRLPQTDMGRVKITFNTGVSQGRVLSLLLFSLLISV